MNGSCSPQCLTAWLGSSSILNTRSTALRLFSREINRNELDLPKIRIICRALADEGFGAGVKNTLTALLNRGPVENAKL